MKTILLWSLLSVWAMAASAQDAADSAWIRKAQRGELELNEATRRAIRSGTLLSPPPDASKLRHNPADLPLIKTFDSIRPTDAPTPRPEALPSFVYRLYEPTDMPQQLPAVGSCMIYPEETERLKALRRIGLRRACCLGPGMLPAGLSISVSYEDMLRYLFWPSHRAKLRNKRHAGAYKGYGPPLPTSDSRVESERRRRNEAINEMRR